VPTIKDWKKMAAETAHAVRMDDVVDLYSLHLKAAMRQLLSEHRAEIEAERNAFKRVVRIVNSVLFGLVRRLDPARRIVFALALLLAISAMFSRTTASAQTELAAAGAAELLLRISWFLLLVLLVFELLDKLRFRDELVLARRLQADLLPAKPPQPAGFEIAAYNRIANLVGGDLYEFADLPDGRLSILFGDASGHGMAAGLVMAVAHAGYRTQLDVDPSPEAMVSILNRILCRTGGPRSFFAAVSILFDPSGRFRVSVAGHPPPQVLGPDGTIRRSLGKGAYPLGIKDGVAYETISDALAAEETLLLYSDGLPEARGASGEEFGDDRIARVISRTAGRGPEDLVGALSAEVTAFCGRQPPEDDVSIVALRRRS
jgi:hypothetical protein